MEFDFSAILLALTVLFGVVWGLDRLFLYKRRKARLDAAGEEYRDPAPVDWSRSLFPVVLVVLLLRSFVAEPFRIPSGSMMPTLDVGDFILVNKFAYGLRVPAFNNKFVDLGEPKRGDVVVFRFPGYLCQDGGRLVRSGDMSCSDPQAPVPAQNWIKRVIGLPGDSIEVHGADLLVNGQRVNAEEIGPYVGNPQRSVDQIMLNMGATVWTEHLGKVSHMVARMPAYTTPNSIPNDRVPAKVPPGCYLVMGDNRNDSLDSRWWGCLPERNLAGKAFLIWMSWKGWGTGGVDFSRIGTVIH
ncbi:S26 family signal peptidase [Rhodanobacter sp. FW510-R12]|uniref:signal peptidase I n=1 Tax=unclassified Rhodanobacter TaxID=2621553 RepID=UPI0007A99A03|nr:MULTISPECIES: signal peptidase I [unclassified Rhodanobacter]KZC17300.1 S26 family signal peptidase [Rhodanobacter sp. FW104-R8]KZC26245.1 S26 family signal peptidase [Rhodanobacter sp. FW510-T8]KZC29353.1 S26 family signal peptidase [Rhodanobacter sp. FW510-R10]